MSLTHSAAFIGCVFLSAPGPKLPFWCTRCSTTVHRRTLACLLTLPTYQVAEDFALPASTASFSLRFTAPLLAAEHWICLPPEVSSAPSLTTVRTWVKTFLFTESNPDIRLIWHVCVHTLHTVDLAVFFLNTWATLKIHDWLIVHFRRMSTTIACLHCVHVQIAVPRFCTRKISKVISTSARVAESFANSVERVSCCENSRYW